MQRVSVVRRKQGLALIEWKDNDDVRQMVWMPESELESDDGTVALVRSPQRGIPYGLPWAHMVELSATPESIEKNLRDNGVWTYEDLLAKPNEALKAIQSAYRFDLAALRSLAAEYVE
jgi:hypothetical protein